ncbi:MAG: RsmD family RNA methyltransferase [Candidatus Thorarchaeota archaeon]|nr:MAG: RsmD family RNA methyltransferase [Candidatus Thorarchaeota archaeon]
MIRTKEYTEGKTTFVSADVDHYSEDKQQPTSSLPVFMNPRMRVNRDFSVIFLHTYIRDNEIDLLCEPLAGSGVRTLRYLNEVPGNFQALMFDANPTAVEMAAKNIETLGFQDRCEAKKGDAKLLLISESRGKRFDYVDVDPFGSPAPFLNAAIQSLNPRNGLLALTATDMPALCGVWPDVAMRRYGGYSFRSPFSHEIAVRLLLGLAYRVAGLNDRSIRPLAVLSSEHFIRAWIGVKASRTESNVQASEIGFVYYCPSCMSTETVSLQDGPSTGGFNHQAESCSGSITTAGPLWIGSLYDRTMLEHAGESIKEFDWFHASVERLLAMMVEEEPLTDYIYTDIHALCDLHNVPPPKTELLKLMLVNLGFRVSRTHFKSTAIRTDAPKSEVVKLLKDYSQERA